MGGREAGREGGGEGGRGDWKEVRKRGKEKETSEKVPSAKERREEKKGGGGEIKEQEFADFNVRLLLCEGMNGDDQISYKRAVINHRPREARRRAATALRGASLSSRRRRRRHPLIKDLESAPFPPSRSHLLGRTLPREGRGVGRGGEIGRASCRERVSSPV